MNKVEIMVKEYKETREGFKDLIPEAKSALDTVPATLAKANQVYKELDRLIKEHDEMLDRLKVMA